MQRGAPRAVREVTQMERERERERQELCRACSNTLTSSTFLCKALPYKMRACPISRYSWKGWVEPSTPGLLEHSEIRTPWPDASAAFVGRGAPPGSRSPACVDPGSSGGSSQVGAGADREPL